MSISYLIQRILWVDCIGAIVTGLAMLLLSGWLSSLYRLSPAFVIVHAFVHLIFGTFSFSLAVRRRRPMALVLLLIFANAAWACLCIAFAITLVATFPVFATGHFALEGIYVGSLAVIEWKWREALSITDRLPDQSSLD
ncbi:MAG: hypothetical protein KBF83_09645 [Pyrinomonadaceae bacterium]|nr:hypothetical protein [Acidobacteriota bacterium]MBP7474817.1 hypothetical protein [Pyrinomonadaceae bacterium]MBP9109804.1 hypothetical protein [Pyrinomonadaceae bacterium]